MLKRKNNKKFQSETLKNITKKKLMLLYFIILFFFFFILLSADQSNVEVINSKSLYRFDGILIPSYVQNGKFNTILILDSTIEKIFLDKSELDIIENGGFKLSFFVSKNFKKTLQIKI
jgi:hypothetical protein